LQEVGQPLSGPARRLDPDRITADENFLKKAKDHKGPNSELLSHILRDCSVTDMAGALFVDEALPRKSVVEFGWCVGLPANDKGEPLTTTEQYFHVKYGAERETAAGGDTTVGKQPIFHRPASSGIYALICNLDLYRIGLNDITREYVIDPASRKARGTALLHSLAATLLKPTGAQRNTQNPHIVGCRGVIATSSTSLPAPTVSPLNHEYAEEIDSAAAVLNGIRPSSVKVMKFETISEGAKILAELARELELPA
jgi:CRISPR-associated protein Cst2